MTSQKSNLKKQGVNIKVRCAVYVATTLRAIKKSENYLSVVMSSMHHVLTSGFRKNLGVLIVIIMF